MALEGGDRRLSRDVSLTASGGGAVAHQLVEQGEALLVHLNAPKEARELGPEAMQIPE